MYKKEQYKLFCEWCKDKNYLDPRLHAHSGKIEDGGYIDHDLTRRAFDAFKFGLSVNQQERDHYKASQVFDASRKKLIEDAGFSDVVELLSAYESLRAQLKAAQGELIITRNHWSELYAKSNDENARLQSIIKKAQEQEAVAEIVSILESQPYHDIPECKSRKVEIKALTHCYKEYSVKAGDKLYALPPIPADHSEDGKPTLAQQLEFVTAERDGIRKHRDQLLERLDKAPHWIEIENPEDAPAGDPLVLWDGCDLSVDFTDTEVDYGTTFFSNGTEATHYLANLMPPPKSEVKPS